MSLEPYYFSYLGNGYVGIQTCIDGTGAYFKPKSFIAGAYDGEYERIVKIPRWSGIFFSIQGEHPFSSIGDIRDYFQRLDFRRAVLLTRYVWMKRGNPINFNISFFASRADPHVAAISFAFSSERMEVLS